MSTLDSEVIRFVAPWIGLGFVATMILGFLLGVRGAITAFAVGAIMPALVYLPSTDTSLVDMVVGRLRAPIPFYLELSRVAFLLELTLNWWFGGALGAAFGIWAHGRPRP